MSDRKVILVVGASQVGKTSLIHRFLKGEVKNNVEPTVGLEKYETIVSLDPINDRPHLPAAIATMLPPGGLELEFWEFGGREKCRQLPRGKQPDGLLLCYDMHDRSSFHSVAHMLMHYRMERHLACENSAIVARQAILPRLVGVLCGTKVDDIDPCEVSTAEAQQFASSNGIHLSLASSSETGEGVKTAIYALAEAVMAAEEDAEAERLVEGKAPRPEEIWSLELQGTGRSQAAPQGATRDGSHTLSNMTNPRGLRPHEPSRGGAPVQDLVEVFDTSNNRSFGARPLATVLELGLLHRAVHVWLCDFETGGILLRKYSPHSSKNKQRWGPSCHAEVRCYDPNTGASPGGPPASESTVDAAARALTEQLGFDVKPKSQDMWFTSSSVDGSCRELIDVFVLQIDQGVLPPLNLRTDELVQWVHFADVFNLDRVDVRTRTLAHFDLKYCSAMLQRLQVRIIHAHTSQKN